MSPKAIVKKKRAKKSSDVLDVELEVTTRGTIFVEMTRAQYAEMKKQTRGGSLDLDLVPGVDWRNLTNALDFEAEVFNVCDDGEYIDP